MLLYHGVAPVSAFSRRADADLGIDPEVFARQMVLLDHAGYETIALDEFVRFVRRREVSLPPRPLLLTFDGARADSWTGSDATLRKLGFNATLFVDVGRVNAKHPDYLTWKELNTVQRSRRWEVQLQSGTGHHQIQYGPAPSDVGPFYAYRGAEERLDGWRERVFSDITWGEEQLSFRVRDYRPLAFAPPYGNYGQAGTNDRRIPRELLARLLQSFDVVFTQDRTGLASPGKAEPHGRIEITRDVTEEELHALLMSARSNSPMPLRRDPTGITAASRFSSAREACRARALAAASQAGVSGTGAMTLPYAPKRPWPARPDTRGYSLSE